jgi:DNA-binding response OmpR family regulator
MGQDVRRRQPGIDKSHRGTARRRASRTRERERLHGRKWRRSRILVIEDDSRAREALALLLSSYDYEVMVAGDGIEAMAQITDRCPDLVVMDWQMPRLSGSALCQALRRRRETMPIVVVTSADEAFERRQPINARLRKPVDASRLRKVIRAQLESSEEP